jgi:hypothetical protein
MKVHVGMMVIPPIWWPLDKFQHLHHVEFDIKFMKLHENFVEICPILWLLDGFCSQHVEFGVKFSFLLKTLCNYMKDG